MSRKFKVLVIDDDRDTQEMIAEFLRANNYLVDVYDDAQLALEDLSQEKVQCDVIISDLILPGISGIEFTRRMKELGDPTPIILITANKKVEVAVEAISAGAYDFVVKPLHFPQLLVSVERALYLLRVKEENQTLKTLVQFQEGSNCGEGVIAKSQAMRNALDLARRVSKSTANVLITGESGTGKEWMARYIHCMSGRKRTPFVAINCAAIPENLLELELFGYGKGTTAGAGEKKSGLFEEAGEGTILIDEIGDLSLSLQSKLLRVLQERKFKRIGESQYRPLTARLLTATQKDLRFEIQSKRFREDLFYRLNVIPIFIPSLRDRRDDIIPLAEFFVRKFSTLNELPSMELSKDVLEYLLSEPWLGNVRELENSIERAVVLANNNLIHLQDILGPSQLSESSSASKPQRLFSFLSGNEERFLTVDEVINRYVKFVLDQNKGIKEKTARDLQIDRKTLYRRLREINRQSS